MHSVPIDPPPAGGVHRRLSEARVLGQDRFARHHLIAGFDQSVVSSLNVALIGAGAIGNEFLKNALLMGLGAVDVFDFDVAELSNLTRSVFLRESDIGINKAVAVVNRAQELYPDCQLTAKPGDIADTLSLSAVKRYDFIVCAVDNLAARLRINELALIVGANWINLAIDARHVVVEVFANRDLPNYGNHACYACGLPDSAFERLQARYSCGGLQRAALIEKKVPTTAITASTVAALGMSELLKFAHAHGRDRSDLKRAQRWFFDTETFSSRHSTLSKSAQCSACGLIDQPMPIVRQMPSATNTWLLSDAIVVDCRCVNCQWQPEQSVWLGKRAKQVSDNITFCPHCQVNSVSVDIQDNLSSNSPHLALLARPQTQVSWAFDGQHYWDRLNYDKGLYERH
jgi:molybdopterin-synthase adenylyltransferase